MHKVRYKWNLASWLVGFAGFSAVFKTITVLWLIDIRGCIKEMGGELYYLAEWRD